MAAEPLDWLSVGLALLWLGGAVWFARWNRPDEPGALRRVPLTALAFVGGLAVTILALVIATGDLAEAMPFIIAGSLTVGVAAFLSALVVDAGAAALGATRTPGWLGAGIVIAILITYCWLSFILNWLSGDESGLRPLSASPFFLTPALLAAAALVWWSELPRPEGSDATPFDRG
jgi:hypothetical protein